MKTGFGSRGFHHLVFVVAMATLALLPTRAFAVRWIIVNHTTGGIGTGYSKSYTFHVSNGTQDYDWSGLNCGPNTTNQTECGEVPTYDLSYYAVTNVTGVATEGWYWSPMSFKGQNCNDVVGHYYGSGGLQFYCGIKVANSRAWPVAYLIQNSTGQWPDFGAYVNSGLTNTHAWGPFTSKSPVNVYELVQTTVWQDGIGVMGWTTNLVATISDGDTGWNNVGGVQNYSVVNFGQVNYVSGEMVMTNYWDSTNNPVEFSPESATNVNRAVQESGLVINQALLNGFGMLQSKLDTLNAGLGVLNTNLTALGAGLAGVSNLVARGSSNELGGVTNMAGVKLS